MHCHFPFDFLYSLYTGMLDPPHAKKWLDKPYFTLDMVATFGVVF